MEEKREVSKVYEVEASKALKSSTTRILSREVIRDE
jgi:hypothetical protein